MTKASPFIHSRSLPDPLHLPTRARKAQIEIMGLVIIVLLVSVGFLFLLSFQAHNQGPAQVTNPARSYDDQQLGTNFVAAALKTNVCNALTLEDLIVACASKSGEYCPPPAPVIIPPDPCDQAQAALRSMTEHSLDIWGTRYNLTITYPGTSITPNPVVIDFQCGAHNASYPSVPFPLPIYRTGENAIVSMRICK